MVLPKARVAKAKRRTAKKFMMPGREELVDVEV